MKKLSVIAFLLTLLSGCSDTWEGFVYPNKNDLSKHISIGDYKSLEACRASALTTLMQLGASERGDYECGLNCKIDSGLGDIKVCQETLR